MGDSIRSLLQRSSSCHQPWQLSTAIALGVVCGLLPKFSLLFCLLAIVCCAIPIHLALAATTCCLLSLVAGSLTQAAGLTGLWSLTNPSLVDIWSSLDRIPWLPWIGLNNSVVHGSLLIGLGVAVPVFFLSRPLAVRLSPARFTGSTVAADPDFAQELRPVVSARQGVSSWLAPPRAATPSHTPVVMLPEQPTATDEPVEWSDLSKRGGEGQPICVSVVDEHTCLELEKLLATCNAEQSHDVDPVRVAQRAAQMVQYVDELLTSFDLHSTPSLAQAPVDVPTTTARPADAQRVTYTPNAAPAPAIQSPSQQIPPPAGSLNNARLNHQPQEFSAAQSYMPSVGPARNLAAPHAATHAGDVALRKDSGVPEAGLRRPVGDAHQAETLRYLLEHLRAIQEKV